MASKPKKTVEPPKPLETYGCTLGGYDQAWYDCRAFAAKIPLDKGAPTRDVLFWKIADHYVPNYFEKHEWTTRVVNTLLEYKWVGVAGCSGCVSGHTRIINPLTGESPTIKELYERGIAPTVMTLDGPAQAEVPFVKGVKELVEVCLSDGSVFHATGEHLVLTPQGFVDVASLCLGQRLFSYAPNLQESTEGTSPSTHGKDALDFQRKASGCQESYSQDCRLCGEQLHSAIDAYRSSSPLQGGVPEHSQHCLRSGDLGTGGRYSPCSHALHPSSSDFVRLHSFLDIPFGLPPYSKRLGYGASSYGPPWLFRSGTHHSLPFSVSNPGYNYRQLASTSLASPFPRWRETSEYAFGEYLSLSRFHSGRSFRKPSSGSCPDTECTDSAASSTGSIHAQSRKDSFASSFKVSLARIVSMRNIPGKQTFYDISVPGPQHYFAEGAIHHNSAKTRNIVGFAATWWITAPLDSSVLLCSTTAKALRKRGWAEVQRYFSSIPGRPGNFVDSRMLWQSKKGDDKHAISGIAVEEGQMLKVADNIKGWHTRRQMVIIDEATAVPPAIFEACSNLYGTPQEFILVMIGNPRARLDEFGKFCEPIGGWDSVSVDDEEWETTPKLDGVNGICIRFDAEKSPNILNPLPDGKLISKYLPTKERVEMAKKKSGSENSPSYWSNERGFWAPEGLTKNVFSETGFIAGKAYGKHNFTGNNFKIIGGFDPARTGGDKAILRFGALGEIEGGSWGLEVMPPITVPINARSTNPIDYQLVEQVRRECENVNYRGQRYSCPPENLGIDASGGGADLCDIFQRMWSPNIMRVLFGGSASEDPCSHEDVRPAKTVYKTKRAEMYFRARDMVDAKQIAGLDADTARELCSLTFDDSKPLINMILKTDYKKAYGKSPDASDSFIILAESARRKGFRLAVTGETINRSQEHEKLVETAHAVYEDLSYVDEEDFETVY